MDVSIGEGGRLNISLKEIEDIGDKILELNRQESDIGVMYQRAVADRNLAKEQDAARLLQDIDNDRNILKKQQADLAAEWERRAFTGEFQSRFTPEVAARIEQMARARQPQQAAVVQPAVAAQAAKVRDIVMGGMSKGKALTYRQKFTAKHIAAGTIPRGKTKVSYTTKKGTAVTYFRPKHNYAYPPPRRYYKPRYTYRRRTYRRRRPAYIDY